MLDIYFGVQAFREEIPLICVKREKEWLKDYDTPKETKIYERFKENDKKQTNLILSSSIHTLKVKNKNIKKYRKLF